MIRQIRLLASMVLLLCAAAMPAHAEKRVALIIGNSQYKHIPSLANPANDARLIAGALQELGFTVAGGGARLDLDKPALDRVVQEFGRAIQGADVALFYYAGHGVQVRGSNYLVPVAANPAREADVDFQMLDANLVLRQMEGSGARLNVVILDACRNNPFGGRGLRAAALGLAQMQAPEGTLISFATQPGAVALDGTGRNSPYTEALAGVTRKPGLDIFRTFNAVGLAVKQATGGQQQPWVSSSPISGDFYFAGRAEEARPGADDGKLAALQKELEELKAKVNTAPEAKGEQSPMIWSFPDPKKDEPKVAVGTFPEQPKPSAPARSLKPGDEFQDCDACPKMVVIPAGSFTMGSDRSEPGHNATEIPAHKVRIAKPIAVGKYEVTVAEWEACAHDGGCDGYIPLIGADPKHPVTKVSWRDAVAYAAWLSSKTGATYRLLTEAEWEYAARAGTRTPFPTGLGISASQANFYAYPEGLELVPVGSYPSNKFRLHDMHGNVGEWVQDCWYGDYKGAPNDGSARESAECGRGLFRGGSGWDSAENVRSAVRRMIGTVSRINTVGFRVARVLTPEELGR